MLEDTTGFQIKTHDGDRIRFRYFTDQAPHTVRAFNAELPFSKSFYHARVSGEEIWTETGPILQCPQENASIFCQPGEVVIGPSQPKRVKTSGMMGIYYGEGKGLDAANIFASVMKEDRELLVLLGHQIWRQGEQVLNFERIPG
jgi:hypothetical protein